MTVIQWVFIACMIPAALLVLFMVGAFAAEVVQTVWECRDESKDKIKSAIFNIDWGALGLFLVIVLFYTGLVGYLSTKGFFE